MSNADSENQTPTGRWSRLTACAYIAMAVAAVLPVLLVEIPPLVDYPNHLARIHVLAGYESSPLLQRNYLVEWRLIPNLAVDGVASVLTLFLPPMAAGRVFLALIILSIAGGITALHKVLFGRIGLWPLASFGIAYSLPFAWGLVNFQFSIGLFLLGYAAWIASERWPPAIRVAVFNVAAAAIYFAHLFGYLALVFTVGLHELSRAFRQPRPSVSVSARRIALSAASFSLPAVLFLAGLLGREQGIEPLALGTWYGDLFSKLSALLSAVLFYGGGADLGLALVIAALALAALLRRQLVVAPAAAWPLIGFLALTLAAPTVLRGLFLDARIGFALGCFFIAAVQPAITRPWLRAALHGALLAALAVKGTAVIQVWQARDREYAAFRDAVRAIAPGSRILAVHDTGDTATGPGLSVRWYMAISIFPALSPMLAWRNIDTLAVIERQAYTPTLFKNPSSQPLRSAPRHREIDPVAPARRVTAAMLVAGADDATAETARRQFAEHGEVAFWAGWPRHFDSVVVIRYPGIEPTRLDGLPLMPLASGSFFDVYRVTPPG